MNKKQDLSINTEDILFIIIIIAVVFNIIGNYYKKKNSNNIARIYYLASLIVTIIVYFYFLNANYNTYKKCNNLDKKLYEIKLFGNCLLIVGALCFIYFQINDPNSKLAPIL